MDSSSSHPAGIRLPVYAEGYRLKRSLNLLRKLFIVCSHRSRASIFSNFCNESISPSSIISGIRNFQPRCLVNESMASGISSPESMVNESMLPDSPFREAQKALNMPTCGTTSSSLKIRLLLSASFLGNDLPVGRKSVLNGKFPYDLILDIGYCTIMLRPNGQNFCFITSRGFKSGPQLFQIFAPGFL